MANSELEEDWSAQLVRRVGKAVKDARGEGRSAKWLAERTAEFGYPVSATVIAKLDSGHRGAHLQVAELIVLAAALGVPPVTLLYPQMPDGAVDVIPGVTTSGIEAVRWFGGETALAGTDSTGRPTFFTSQKLELMKLSRERDDASDLVSVALRAVDASDVQLTAIQRKKLDAADRELAAIEKRIRELGGYIDGNESDD